jgi:hypothetical protein
LLLVDLILNPNDPWAVDVLRVWLILLGSHAVGLVAGWVTWRAIRPHRLVELQHIWTETEEADVAASAAGVPAGPPQPLPATGRFTPGRIPPDSEADDERTGLSGVLGALGDAVVEVGELTLAGGARIRRGVSGVLDWIQGDDEEFDDGDAVVSPESQPAQQAASRAPARWVVPTGSGKKSAAPSIQPVPDPAPAQRPPAPIVPIPRPVQQSAAPAAHEPAPPGTPAATARPVEPTPLTPRPARRREVSG